MHKVGVVLQLARTGGTIIAKCLQAMENTHVLSEVNPSGCIQDIGVNEDSSYLKQIRYASQLCELGKKQLIIRDYTHINFFGDNPPYKLEQLDALEGFDVRGIAVVRHPLDQYMSIKQIMDIEFDEFMYGYAEFVNRVKERGLYISKFEDFCKNPYLELAIICARIGIGVEFDPSCLLKWPEVDSITGENKSKFPTNHYDQNVDNFGILTNTNYHYILEELEYEDNSLNYGKA